MDLTPDQICVLMAAENFGVITRTQALEAGHTPSTIDRRLRSGRWIVKHPGVYVIAGSVDSWTQRAKVALCIAGPHSAISHLSAAYALRLRDGCPLRFDITAPKRSAAWGLTLHRCLLAPIDKLVRGPLVYTSPVRTIIDLAGVVDFDELEDCLEEALLHRQLTLRLLSQRVGELATRGRKGMTSLRRLMEIRDSSWAPNESKFESLLFRVLRERDVPLPVRQHSVFDGRQFVTRLDFSYPDVRLAVPADSYEWHVRRRTWDKDIDQRNRLLRLGWRIRPTTWTELKRKPDSLARDITQLLSEPGPEPWQVDRRMRR